MTIEVGYTRAYKVLFSGLCDKCHRRETNWEVRTVKSIRPALSGFEYKYKFKMLCEECLDKEGIEYAKKTS